MFLAHEIDYYLTDEWAEWRAHHRMLIELIDQFTRDNFGHGLVDCAKASALAKPHPFWAVKIRRLSSAKGESR